MLNDFYLFKMKIETNFLDQALILKLDNNLLQ